MCNEKQREHDAQSAYKILIIVCNTCKVKLDISTYSKILLT